MHAISGSTKPYTYRSRMKSIGHGRIDGPTIDLRFDDSFRVATRPTRSLQPHIPRTRYDIGIEAVYPPIGLEPNSLGREQSVKQRRTSNSRRCVPGVIYLFTALVCFGACVPVGWAIHSVARAVSDTERSIDPLLQAAMPSVRDAGYIMNAARDSTRRIELLINNTLDATGSVAPAMERAAAMLNTTNALVERMATLVKHPIMRVQLEG